MLQSLRLSRAKTSMSLPLANPISGLSANPVTALVKATIISCLTNCPLLLPNLSPCATFALLPIPGREQFSEPAKIHHRPCHSHARNPVTAFPLTHSKIPMPYSSARRLPPAPVTPLTRALPSPARPPRTGRPAATHTRQTHSHPSAPRGTHSSPRHLHDPLLLLY